MRQARASVGLGVAGLSALILVTACARPGVAIVYTAPPGAPRDARAQIAERVASRVEAMRNKDVDAMLDGTAGGWTDGQGRPVTREQVRNDLLRDWSTVDRTLSLSVHIDSIQFADSSRATVYTTQRWRRIVFAVDGSKHDVQTKTSVSQEWARLPQGWRGLPAVQLVAEGPTLVDGIPARQAVVVSGKYAGTDAP